ncbi:AraC family transcriptional regulator [Parabacteroides gordonii]|uniref:helix-turn-helix domain-containing protein n=1 Tax=Parabacteroides gordonii TaxID=574930 RepID=UPI0026EFC254|nr:AraC family transcriptional regulator [Parabacteroides gordonii]
MENLPLIELAELNKSIVIRDSFQDIFSIADIDGNREVDNAEINEFTTPMRLDALLMVMALEGSAEISLDYVPYVIDANCFVIIMPTHTIQLNRVSKDFKGKLLVVSRYFLDECNPAKRSPSMANYMQLKKNPCTTFEPEETELINDQIELLRKKIKNRSHFFQKEVMQNAFVGFLLEVANILMGKKDGMLVPALSRKEELFEQFLQLLFEHCKEQHVVTFYAEKLFITPQYLSLILKELTGKSANKWIDDALIVEAKILLKAPQATVQQVADILHFSDQSTFGKFFKKHMGVSPMEYRKS